MRKFHAKRLRRHLRAAGLAEAHIQRMSDEIEDHFEDLKDEAIDCGMNEQRAERHALDQLGSYESLAMASREHPELQTFRFRHPKLFLLSRPVAMLAMAPFLPIAHALEHSETISRWFYATILGSMFTAAILLFMQLSISLS